MRVLSLFDGIGCGRVALDRAGIAVSEYVACEIDNDAITVAKSQHADIVHVGDVNYISADKNRFDLVIAGSPCQGFSRAGGGLAFHDARSVLYFEFLRIVNQVQPKYFMLENVVMRKDCAATISQSLGVEGRIINSDVVSAHNRPRMYWTNFEYEVRARTPPLTMNDIADVEDCTREVDWIRYPARRGRTRVQQVGHYGGNSQGQRLYSMAGTMPCIMANKTGGRKPAFLDTETGVKFPTVTMLERCQTLPDGYTKAVSKTAAIQAIGNGWTVDVVAQILKGTKA